MSATQRKVRSREDVKLDNRLRACAGCCKKCCSCVTNCMSRIPYGTFVGLVIGIIGMLLFLGGFIGALTHINNIQDIKGILDFGYKVAGVMFAVAVGLGLFVLLVACFTTGATRKSVLSGCKSKLIGKCFTSLLIIVQYVLYLAWAIITPLLVIPVLAQIVLNVVCNFPEIKDLRKCLDLKDYGLAPLLEAIGKGNNTLLCAKKLDNFCVNVDKAGSPLIVAMVGAFLAALGTVHVLMSLSANFAYVKSYTKLNNSENADDKKKGVVI